MAAAAATTAAAAAAAGVAALTLARRRDAGHVAGAAARPAAVAARTAGVVTIPFPSPPPGPTVGRFHTLTALQCRLYPASATGGASPDPAAVANPTGRGGTGWMARVSPSAPDVFIPYGAGTCASPLEDAVQLEYLAAPAEFDRLWKRSGASTNVTSGGDAGAEFKWAGNAFSSNAASWATWNNPPAAGEVTSDWFRPHPCGAARGRTGLVCEEEVARLLTLQRNHRSGAVMRQTGLFDVLSVTRTTHDVVLDKDGWVVAAVDSVSNEAGWRRNTVIMYTPRDGPPRPVLIGEAALLSLGRGVLADPTWLGDSFPTSLNASVQLRAFRGASMVRGEKWFLRDGAEAINRSSLWLQELASVICRPPSTSFVVDGILCSGVEPPARSGRAAFHAGGRRVADTLGLGAGRFLERSEAMVLWHIVSPAKPPSATNCSSFDGLDWKVKLRQPIWLLGRKSREINATGPEGQTEAVFASRFYSCALNQTQKDKTHKDRGIFDAGKLTAVLSQHYRRDLFDVDPPPDPISSAELLLVVLVVVPKAAALLHLLVRRRGRPRRTTQWEWRAALTLALAAAAGGVALVGVGYVDQQERRGHAWRAATGRLETRFPANGTELFSRRIEYAQVVVQVETLFVVARTGYRPHLTRRLLVGTAVAYSALTVATLLRAAAALFRAVPAAVRPRQPGGGDGEDRAVGAPAGATPASEERRPTS